MWNRWMRSLKYQYLKLMRSSGGPSVVARSFALGLFIEFITLPTLGLAFFLLFPITRFTKGLFSVSLIGFLFGKVILPIFLTLNYKVGSILIKTKQAAVAIQANAHWFSWASFKAKGISFLTGSASVGLVVAFASYWIVYWGFISYQKKRAQKRNMSLA